MSTKKTSKRRAASPQQLNFAKEYLEDGNATQAAIRAGYSPKQAGDRGPTLLKHPEIAKIVAEHRANLKQKVRERSQLLGETTLRELARISYFDPRRLVNRDGTPKKVSELDEEAAAAIAGFDTQVRWVKGKKVVTTSYRLHNKLAALDQAAKITGEYKPEKRELTGPDGGPIQARIAVEFVKPSEAPTE